MKGWDSMKKAYLFLAYGFEETEALTTVDLLRWAGIEVITVSITPNNIISGAHKIPVVSDIKIDESDFCDADAIIIPGGQPGVNNLNACDKIKDIIKTNFENNKLICAICAAPIILGEMGLLKGKKATCYPGNESALKGAVLSNDKVCVDGNIVTSRGVGTAIDFALEIIKILNSEIKAESVKKSILAD